MAKKILIVEDEPGLSKILKKQIERLGYAVAIAVDGSAALAKIKSSKPDLVILDLMVPKKSGIEVLRELRVDLEDNVPVLVLSNLEHMQDIEASRHYGVADYIIKSDVSLRYLTTRIVQILEAPAS
jgi:two-component system alkaline phosphatase synthesis response regulator PhoP